MNNRESPYRRWAIDRQNEIRSIFNIWKNKLHLKQEHLKLCILSPSKSVELRNCGWEALCNWNKGENLWKIIVPVDIKEVILIHELGHLYFPKEVNDMRLAPAKENEGLNTQIMKCLNSLEDCFVNFHLSKYEDYYKLWSNIMQTDLDDVINRENELYNIMAYYLLYYIEYNYVYKENDRFAYSSKIDTLLTNTENLLISKSEAYNTKRLSQLKLQLARFELLKEWRNSEKIILFMSDIIRDLSLWSNEIVNEQLEKRFKIMF